MSPVRKVLMLHGYSQNASIFNKRMAAIRKACKDTEFIFIDAPHVLLPADIPSSWSLDAPEVSTSSSDPALTPRGWFRSNPERTIADGMEESLDVIGEVLKGGKFDGVFGFSQGAAMAAVVSAALEKPHLYPSFLSNGEPIHPPLKFCVSVSGFFPPGSISQALLKPSYSTPTLHVLGRNDVIVVEERSRKLVEVSQERRVEEHDGGHFVPAKASWRNFFRDYIKDPVGPVPSPGRSVSSSATPEPPSGAVTPLLHSGMATPAFRSGAPSPSPSLHPVSTAESLEEGV
ncbi:hypothetical protein JAAARDRAFT_70691 [Jaapia argillacea MUCL 33604]|uniref:Serine hydrolase domain-containing protein n=1 Tax=Jaapia argillacea MUCL 33604 TaxID=933084 RepID=A0A067Q1C3_9AGAM|nr:hypothetical protein JAAARDRAFT_70691 [Jaapia argillacea MUCL 33604]